MLKEGPCTTGYNDCKSNPECQKENSDHWIRVLVFDMTPRKIEDFVPVLDDLLGDQTSPVRKQIVLSRYELDPIPYNYFTFGELYQKKRAIDPIIDQIVDSKLLKSNADVENVVDEVYKFNLTHRVKYYKFEA